MIHFCWYNHWVDLLFSATHNIYIIFKSNFYFKSHANMVLLKRISYIRFFFRLSLSLSFRCAHALAFPCQAFRILLTIAVEKGVTPCRSVLYHGISFENMPMFFSVHALMRFSRRCHQCFFFFLLFSFLFYFVNCWKTNLFCNVVILFVAIRKFGVAQMFVYCWHKSNVIIWMIYLFSIWIFNRMH